MAAFADHEPGVGAVASDAVPPHAITLELLLNWPLGADGGRMSRSAVIPFAQPAGVRTEALLSEPDAAGFT